MCLSMQKTLFSYPPQNSPQWKGSSILPQASPFRGRPFLCSEERPHYQLPSFLILTPSCESLFKGSHATHFLGTSCPSPCRLPIAREMCR